MLDLDTGTATLIGGYGSSAFVMHGLEYDSSTGKLYGATSHDGGIYEINKTTGFATLVGTTGLSSFINLGYDSDNDIMYASNSGADSFYKINLMDGSATLIGALNNSTNPNGMAYDYLNDIMFMVDNSQDNLYKIDLNTGNAEIIGSTGSGNLLGLVYIVPEPATLSLLVLGSIFFARRRSR